MSKSLAIIIGLILLLALLLFSMTYTVNFHEVAIKTRFGQVNDDSIITEPGLKFRLPLFADKVTTFDTRLQLRESPLETVQTVDGLQVVVKAYLMWKVDNESAEGPLRFFESYSSVEEANASLGDQFKTAMLSGLSRFRFNDLVGQSSRLAEAEAAIKSELDALQSKGIKAVTVGVSQLVLPPRTAQAVLGRMQATSTALSDEARGKGTAEASGMQNRASAQADKIRAFANQRAAEIRAQGDQDAARYYTLMSEAEDLAVFLQWRDAWMSSLSQYTTVVLPSTIPPFHMFNLHAPTDSHGVPQPTSTQPEIAGANATPAGTNTNNPAPASGGLIITPPVKERADG